MNVYPFGDYHEAERHARKIGGTVLFDEWTLNHALLTERGRMYWAAIHSYELNPTIARYIVVS